MQKLIEFNENQDTLLYLPSHLEDLRHKSKYFDVPDLDTKIQRHGNPHYWLQQDIEQIKNFQYKFFKNIILTEDTIPQVTVFTHFLLKFFRFNYQILWEQQDQQETSDKRPYITTNISHEISPEQQTPSLLPQFVRHNITQEQDDVVNFFQNPELPQSNPLYPQISQGPNLQQINPSEAATTQKTSELSDVTEQTEQTVQNTQSFTITNDSNLLQIPTHNVTPEETDNQNPDTISNTTQDNTSVLSTSHTNNTQQSQQSQTLTSPSQNFDPPSIPSQLATSNNTHDSPQPGSSNTEIPHTVHFQTPTPPSPPQIQTSTYTPAQNNQIQNVQTG